MNLSPLFFLKPWVYTQNPLHCPKDLGHMHSRKKHEGFERPFQSQFLLISKVATGELPGLFTPFSDSSLPLGTCPVLLTP